VSLFFAGWFEARFLSRTRQKSGFKPVHSSPLDVDLGGVWAAFLGRTNKATARVLAPPLQRTGRTFVQFGGRKLSYFGGCDYFRLSSDARILWALKRGLKAYGLTVAASRSTTGNHSCYERLEAALAKFFAAPSAVLLSSGYLSNLAVAQALAGTFSHALMDERAHASLVDAAQFLDCPIIKFNHRDPEDVAKILQRIGRGTKPILLTDGMFSHDGSIAPLKAYSELLAEDGVILLDDAHAAGVLGRTGKGTQEHASVSRRRLIQTIALSKAFGVYGGAVLCGKEMRQKIQAKSRLFSGNTPLPLPLASAALRAVEVLSSTKALRAQLLWNIQQVKSAVRAKGYSIAETPCPVIPLIPPHPRDVPVLKRRCLANGVFPSFIQYSGGPADGYFRFALSSEHSRAQLNALIRCFPERRSGVVGSLSQPEREIGARNR